MCGIAGFINFKADLSEGRLFSLSQKMGDAMAYRGPDSWANWVEERSGVALVHRRLAIIDLTETGAQPMLSQSGRYVMVYNGEIYNHNDLRPQLLSKGVRFKGTSDSEVILEYIAHFGIQETIEKCVGMFTIALWDKKERCLTLLRDRMGIKPLYWARTASAFIFGSELKALRQHPDCPSVINRNAISSYLRHNYIPAPHSIYAGVYKLDQGHMLEIQYGQEPILKAFWNLDDAVNKGVIQRSEEEAVAELHDLLKDAVGCRMMADVPFGAFLSGGIDSSLVASLMQAQSSMPIKTFSIGFNENGYDEAKHAKAVAQHLGTNHTELYVTSDEAMDVIPLLPKIYDEPFADSSQIPTYLVSKMTREHVTVALSGDGGDELFAGYTRYFVAKNYGKMVFDQPQFLKSLEKKMIESLSPQKWNRLASIIPKNKRPSHFGDKLYKLADILHENMDGFYCNLISHWNNPDNIVIDGHENKNVIWDKDIKTLVPDFINYMQYLDMRTYLPDDILTKVDRASMAVSLEARVPLIDHRIVEYSWSLANDLKMRDGQGKWILKQVLYKYIPKELIERPKMGFGVPIDTWLRGPLREWAEDLLSEEMFKKHGLLHRQPVIEKWREHLSEDRNWQYHLWNVLMLHAWAEEYS